MSTEDLEATGAEAPVAEGPEEAVIPSESPKEETQWATGDDLPKLSYLDVKLPIMQKMVRIRYLSNAEATGLAVLPDLSKFSELIAEKIEQDGAPTSPEETAKLTIEMIKEKTHYMELVAHLCVMDPRGGEGTDCCNAAIHIGPHPKSLWDRDQVMLLEAEDLTFITNVAERTVILESVRPLSQDPMPSDTPPPVNTGE